MVSDASNTQVVDASVTIAVCCVVCAVLGLQYRAHDNQLIILDLFFSAVTLFGPTIVFCSCLYSIFMAFLCGRFRMHKARSSDWAPRQAGLRPKVVSWLFCSHCRMRWCLQISWNTQHVAAAALFRFLFTVITAMNWLNSRSLIWRLASALANVAEWISSQAV